MPAYFNLSLQFRREDLYPDFVKDFFDALELAGLKGRERLKDYDVDSVIIYPGN